MEILKTTNYKQFKLIRGNRETIVYAVKQLAKSIEETNLLESNPIIVNSKMEVIDGQHRLMAAERLGVPIYYTVIPQGTLDDVILLNANNRRWELADYLASFCERGYPDYLALKEFLEVTGLTLRLSISLAASGSFDSKSFVRAFKTGEFKATGLSAAYEFAALAAKFKPYTGEFVWRSRDFLLALRNVLKFVPAEQLLEKVASSGEVILKHGNPLAYTRVFEDLFNSRSIETAKRFY